MLAPRLPVLPSCRELSAARSGSLAVMPRRAQASQSVLRGPPRQQKPRRASRARRQSRSLPSARRRLSCPIPQAAAATHPPPASSKMCYRQPCAPACCSWGNNGMQNCITQAPAVTSLLQQPSFERAAASNSSKCIGVLVVHSAEQGVRRAQSIGGGTCISARSGRAINPSAGK